MSFKKKLTVLLILSSLSIFPLFSISNGEYSIKPGFAFDSLTSEGLIIYEPSLSIEKTRFYNSGNLGTMFNFTANFPLFYSLDNYVSDPFRLFLSFDTSFNFALRYNLLRYYIGPSFSLDALVTEGTGMRFQYGLGLYQNIGIQHDFNSTFGIAGGAELYFNIFSVDFLDNSLTGFFKGWKMKARLYLALTISYKDGFTFTD